MGFDAGHGRSKSSGGGGSQQCARLAANDERLVNWQRVELVIANWFWAARATRHGVMRTAREDVLLNRDR